MAKYKRILSVLLSVVFTFTILAVAPMKTNAVAKKVAQKKPVVKKIVQPKPVIGSLDALYNLNDTVKINVSATGYKKNVNYKIVITDNKTKKSTDITKGYSKPVNPLKATAFNYKASKAGSYTITAYSIGTGIKTPKPLFIKKTFSVYNGISLTKKGTKLSSKTVNGDLYIGADNITITNVKVKGTVFINPGKNGTARINNVVAANIKVLSGAKNSIYLTGVKADQLTVDSTSNVRIVANEGTEIGNTKVTSYSILDANGGVLGTVTITIGSKGEPEVVLKGTFTEPIIVQSAAKIIADQDAQVPVIKLETADNESVVSLNGNFQAVEVNKPVNLQVEKNSSVQAMAINAAASITNEKNSNIVNVDINTGNKEDKVILSGEYNSVVVKSQSNVELAANSNINGEMKVTGSAQIKIDSTSSITKLEISNTSKDDNIIIDGSGIGIVHVSSEAKLSLTENTNLNISVDSKKVTINPAQGATASVDTNNNEITAGEGQGKIINVDLTALAKAVDEKIAAEKAAAEAQTAAEKAAAEKAAKEAQTALEKAVAEAKLAAEATPTPTVAPTPTVTPVPTVAPTATATPTPTPTVAPPAPPSGGSTGGTTYTDKDKAIAAAINAISALPMENIVQISDKINVIDARAKVDYAIAIGATSSSITNLSKLVALEKRIADMENAQTKAAYVKAAIDAIVALPDSNIITLTDKDKVTTARLLVTKAVSFGAANSEISNLEKLIRCEASIEYQDKLANMLKVSVSVNQTNVSITVVNDTVNEEDVTITIYKNTGEPVYFDQLHLEKGTGTVNRILASGVYYAIIGSPTGARVKTSNFSVDPVNATGISLNSTTLACKVGQTVTLTATITPSNATDKSILWESSDIDTALVANGVVTAIKAGSVTINAYTSDKKFKASCTVTITDDSAVLAAIATAKAAIENLSTPSAITLNDKANVVLAREKVTIAIEKGAVVADITNYQKLLDCEAKITELELTANSMQAVVTTTGSAVKITVTNSKLLTDTVTIKILNKTNGNVANQGQIILENGKYEYIAANLENGIYYAVIVSNDPNVEKVQTAEFTISVN